MRRALIAQETSRNQTDARFERAAPVMQGALAEKQAPARLGAIRRLKRLNDDEHDRLARKLLAIFVHFLVTLLPAVVRRRAHFLVWFPIHSYSMIGGK